MTTQEIIDELSRAKHRGFGVWHMDSHGRYVSADGDESIMIYPSEARKLSEKYRRHREALSLDAVMPVLEAIVAEADALDENDVAPVADYLDVSGYVSTTIGQLRAVVAAWKARRQ